MSGYELVNIMMSRADPGNILPCVVMRMVKKGTREHVLWNVV